MPHTRLTLSSNANHSQATVVLLDLSRSPLSTLLAISRNKLRLKKASHVYSTHEKELLNSSDFLGLTNGDVLFISCGEPFVGSVSGPLQASAAVVRLVSNLSPIEPEALVQLNNTARLEGMRLVVGMPDLHPGQSSPIGAVFVSTGFVFPKLIGGDIGCGMAFYSTDIHASSTPTHLARRLHGIEGPYEGSTSEWLAERGISPTAFDQSLGTIGGGNHFAELQGVSEVRDVEAFNALGLSADRLALLVHSGSRGLGQDALRRTPSSSITTPSSPASPPSPELESYLKLHSNACSWALANRELIAHRFLSALQASAEKILDVWHNNVERSKMTLPSSCGQDIVQDVWIHRKGAAPSDRGPLMIPGSRGAKSYLCLPVGDQEATGRSVAHGAGRLWDRGKAREKGEKRFGREGRDALRTTALGSAVVCEDDQLLFEEVPEAYKDIDAVVQDLVELGLIRIIAIMEPVVTYKTRSCD